MLKLTEDRGWHILNGQVAGDYNGELTYVGKRSASVIDYAIVNTVTMQKIRRFRVEDGVESDHLPLGVELEGYMERDEREVERRKRVVTN